MYTLELLAAKVGYKTRQGYLPVLDDINLKVRPGEFIAIVGFSGAGKTTLISAIAGLLDLDQGRLLVNG